MIVPRKVRVRSTRTVACAALAATVLLSTSGAALAFDFIVESRSGGQNFAKYSELGVMSNASSKSTVPDVTPGIGSRFGSTWRSVAGEKHALFSADLPVTGTYEVFTTWGNQSNRRPNIRHTITHASGTTDVHIDQSATMNVWVSLGQYSFNAGIDAGQVDINNLSTDASGNMMADSVKWTLVSPCADVPPVGLRIPLLSGDTSVTVTDVNAAATKVTLYANGVFLAENTSPTAGTTVVQVPGGLSAGQEVTATQTMPVNGTPTEGCLYAGPIVDDCNQIPAVSIDPTDILLTGNTTVRVIGVDAGATAVKVYSNGLLIGTNSSPGGASTVTVNVSALQSGATISATQTLQSTGGSGGSLEGCIPMTGPQVDNCNQIPAVRPTGLISDGNTLVRVTNVRADATEVKVYANDVEIGSTTSVTTPTTVVTVSPLVLGQTIKATQRIGVHGCLPTTGVRVMAEGVIEDFEGTVSVVNNPVTPQYRTWYDVASDAFTHVLLSNQTGTGVFNPVPLLQGSRCLSVLDHGWTNGAYVKYEQVIPASGEYHLSVEMLVDERDVDPDFIQTYQVGVVVNGAHRDAGGILPNITSPVGNYNGPLTPQQDGYFDQTSEPFEVLSETFTANEGDDLLLAFSTSVNGYVRGKSAGIGTPLEGRFVGMLVDNIKLIPGPRPCRPEDVPAVAITQGPLEAGGTQVAVSNVSPLASLVTVYEFTAPDSWREIGSVNPAGNPNPTVPFHVGEALVAGTTIVATQTMMVCTPQQLMEGVKSVLGPVVGTGENTAVMLSLGIRETGGSGPVGADGGTTGPIEWVGASTSVGGAPQGKLITPDSGWQTVEFWATGRGGTDPVLSFVNGNGVLDGAWGVLEHLAVTTTGTNTGRYVLYVDNVTNGATMLADFEGLTPGEPALFRAPVHSGTTSVHLLNPPNASAVDGSVSDGGTQSLRVEFQFRDNQASRWVRLTSVGGGDAPAMPYQNPQVNLDEPVTMRVLLQACPIPFADADGDGDVDMDDFALFQLCYDPAGVPPGCACFDRNDDGKIDGQDLQEFINCATGAGVPFDPNNPPPGCNP